MNNTLAIHFEEDFLMAATEPFPGKFKVLMRGEEKRFPFYFFIDNVNNKIDFSFLYRNDFLDGKENYVGDFLNQVTNPAKKYFFYQFESELINLLINILDDVRKEYFSYLKSFQETIPEKDIPLNISFSDNIGTEIRTVLKNFLIKQGFVLLKDNQTIPQLLVNHYIRRNNLKIENAKYVAIESVGSNLNMTLVLVNANSVTTSNKKVFNDFGTDPRIQVIAKKIVDDVNRQEGLLNDTNALKREYKRHQTKAVKIVEVLKKFNKPFIRIETTFAIEPNRKLITNLSIEEIDKLCFLHARQFASFFTDHFLIDCNLKTLDIDKIFLIGNTLNNDLVKKEFDRFGAERTIYLSDDFSHLLQELLAEEKTDEPDANATMFLENPNTAQKQQTANINASSDVDSVIVSTLKIGQKIKLTTFDPTPGKGSAIEEFQYTGDSKFIVLSSTRSLLPGDMAVSVIPEWKKNNPVDFDVHRSNKFFGRYRTRPVVRIEVFG